MGFKKKGIVVVPPGLSIDDFMARCLADAIAIQHRFKAEPCLKNGKPFYQHAHTVEKIAHAKKR